MGSFPWTGLVYNGLLPGAVPTAGPPSGQVGTFVLEAVKPAGRVMLFRWKKVGELEKGVLEQVPGVVELGSADASVCVCVRTCTRVHTHMWVHPVMSRSWRPYGL